MITLLIDDTARFPYGIEAATVPQKSQLQQAQDTRGESTLEAMSPAPWRLVDGAPTVVVDAEGKYVATTSTEVDAIAIAALPALLALMKKTRTRFAACARDSFLVSTYIAEIDRMIDRVEGR